MVKWEFLNPTGLRMVTLLVVVFVLVRSKVQFPSKTMKKNKYSQLSPY